MKSLSAQLLLICSLVAGLVFAFPAHAQRYSWINTITGPSFDETFSMSIAPGGDLHVVGVFSDSLNVGGMTVKALGNYDIFNGRFNSKGKAVSADAHGGLDVDEAYSIVADNKGNYYFGGAFVDQALVSGQLIEGLDANSMDMFVAKFDKYGVLQWAKVFGSTAYDEGAPYVAVDSTGNVYVAGGVGGTGQFGTKTYKAVGKLDAFVAKLNSAGDFQWVVGSGSADNDMAKGVSVSPNGDRVYSVGTFMGQVSFGNSTYESYSGKPDFFVRAVSATGQPLWTQRLGWSGNDDVISCSTIPDGRLLLTGSMNQTMYFGPTKTLKAAGEFCSDVFVSRMSKEGEFELLKNYGSFFDEKGLCIYGDAKANMYVGGWFDSTTVLGTYADDSRGGNDGFVMRIVSNGTIDWVRSFGGPYDDDVRAVVVDPKNIPYIAGTFDTYAMFDDEKVKGDRFTDVFVAALDCGPSTLVEPRKKEVKVCEGQDSLFQVHYGYPSYEWYVNGEKIALTGYKFNTNSLKQGTYKVYCRIQGLDDCIKNSDTVTFTVIPGLQQPLITRNADDLTCSVDLVNYQWYLEGNPIAGATSRTVKISGQGYYRVLISDTAGCTRWSDNFLVGTTDVVDLIDGTMITVYPNPTSGDVTLQGADGSEITISDMLGRVIAHVERASALQTLTIDGVAGMYSLTMRKDGKPHTLLITKR